MRRIWADVALCCVLLILIPMPGFSADLPTAAAERSVAPEICFPLPDGERMLRNLESLEGYRVAVEAADGAVNSCEARSEALEGRVVEQDRELTDARKLVEDTREAGEEAAKVAAGPWYSRALSVVKWIALGIIVGFVGGTAK